MMFKLTSTSEYDSYFIRYDRSEFLIYTSILRVAQNVIIWEGQFYSRIIALNAQIELPIFYTMV